MNNQSRNDLGNALERFSDWMSPLKELLLTTALSNDYVLSAKGVLAVCHRKVGILGEEEWLHIALPGLPSKFLTDIELDLGFRNEGPEVDVLKLGIPKVTGGYDFDHYVPEEIKQMLLAANGMSLFGGHLHIWGVQTTSREMRHTVYGDFKMDDGSMTFFNIWSRPKNIKPRILCFGLYRWNASILYMRENDPSVYNCDRDGREIFHQWESIGDWIKSETLRLSSLFDAEGNLLDINAPTCP